MIQKIQQSLISPDTPESGEGIVAAIDAIEDKINEIIDYINSEDDDFDPGDHHREYRDQEIRSLNSYKG